MKKILSHGILAISKYRMKCPYCDCEFEYQAVDVYYHNSIHSRYVDCPECNTPIHHTDSIKTTIRVSTENL